MDKTAGVLVVIAKREYHVIVRMAAVDLVVRLDIKG